MRRLAVATITQSECDKYAFLFEKLLAYRSLKSILRNNDKIKSLISFPPDVLDNIGANEKETNKKINIWWDKIDEKYILEYDDSRVLALDFDECIVYSINKKEWYKENHFDKVQS